MASSIETPDWSSIPAPEDDGAAQHLLGMRIPSIPLKATEEVTVDIASLPGRTVVFAYPRTGKPGVPNPDGWDMIPGARGCTPQTCAFQNHFKEITALGVDRLFGLSTQDPAYQKEFADRLHLPFSILSDEALKLTTAMQLPTFQTHGMTLLKRLTLVILDGVVEHIFYPVFPPDENAGAVVAWLKSKA
jgi:peroxiredoxin